MCQYRQATIGDSRSVRGIGGNTAGLPVTNVAGQGSKGPLQGGRRSHGLDRAPDVHQITRANADNAGYERTPSEAGRRVPSDGGRSGENTRLPSWRCGSIPVSAPRRARRGRARGVERKRHRYADRHRAVVGRARRCRGRCVGGPRCHRRPRPPHLLVLIRGDSHTGHPRWLVSSPSAWKWGAVIRSSIAGDLRIARLPSSRENVVDGVGALA